MSEPRSILGRLERATHFLGVALIGLGAVAAAVPAPTGAPVVIVVGGLLAITDQRVRKSKLR